MNQKKEKWSVWIAVVYFEDDPTEFKERPVIVLDDHISLCFSLKVTSKEKNDKYHVKLKQWMAAGLPKPSWVDISKIIKIRDENFRKEIGMLDIEDIYEIMKRLHV